MKRSGASDYGFHLLETFKTCKRKFYISKVLGIEADRKPFQLIFGGAFHHGKAIFYETKSESKALKAYEVAIKESKHEIEDPSRYLPALLSRGGIMLKKWISLLGKNDLKIYEILSLEEVLRFKLPNGFTFTAKPDVVVKSDSSLYIFDTKTSWYSANLQSEQLEVGDQTSAYLYGWNLIHRKTPASGLVPDCISWNFNSSDPDKIEVSRSRLVTRSNRELNEWALGTMSDLSDMAGRIASLKKNDLSELFPRTTSYCLSYNRKCEYLDICRHRIKEGVIPTGYHENTWEGKTQLLKLAKKGVVKK
jgi:hypothetical protein